MGARHAALHLAATAVVNCGLRILESPDAAGVSHLLSREQRPFDCGEIVAGRNNKHLDFRMSVLKTVDGEKMNVAISTICTVHNLFGKIYCASSFRFTGTASSR